MFFYIWGVSKKTSFLGLCLFLKFWGIVSKDSDRPDCCYGLLSSCNERTIFYKGLLEKN